MMPRLPAPESIFPHEYKPVICFTYYRTRQRVVCIHLKSYWIDGSSCKSQVSNMFTDFIIYISSSFLGVLDILWVCFSNNGQAPCLLSSLIHHVHVQADLTQLGHI
jgi:hypothetical protein